MSLPVSLIVAASSAAKAHGLIASVDAQSLPTDQFELIVLDSGLDEDSAASLGRLAERRPNVSVLDASGDWLAEVQGEYVLVLDERYPLFPQSVARLLGHANQHGLDVVAGRIAHSGQAVGAAFLSDSGADAGSAHREDLLAAPIRLVRRERAVQDGASVGLGGGELAVGGYATYPVALRDAPSTRTGIIATAEAPTLSWSGPDLVLTTSGTVEGGGDTPLTAALSLRHLESHLSYLVPAETDVDESGWRLSSSFSPSTAAAGERLPRGLYQVEVLLGGAGAAGADPLPLPGAAAAPAFFDEFVVAVTDGPQGLLHIDSEASKSSVTGLVTPADASITETADGSLLRLTLPDANVQTTQSLVGRVGLDKFTLPATWETESGHAVLTAYLSGLAGTYTLVSRCGFSPYRHTGLSLVIGGDGEMTLIPMPPPAKPAPAAKPAAAPVAKPAKKAAKKAASPKVKARKRRKKKPVAKGPMAKLRRSVPKSWEPGIRRLRQQPLARAIYRKATGLTKSGAS